MGAGRATNTGDLSNERAGQAIHVLLFEDSVSDAQYLQQLLKESSADFRVTWSAQLDAVLQILEGPAPVDVILADRTLLDVSNFSQLQSKKADVPVVLLTKGGDDAVASSLLREGAQDYLTKWDFDSRGLERAIRCAILRKDAENRSKDRERRYVLALKAAREGVWDWDLRNNRVVWSDVCREILDWDEAMLDRIPADWVSMVHPDDVKGLRYAVAFHLKGRSEHLTLEFRTRGRDGSYRWIQARGAALRGPDGQPYRLTGSFTDITERKDNEQQLTFTAFHDPLTRLANRTLFLDRLAQITAQAERRGGFFAVLFLDLDAFKTVNDNFGHGVGDRLLVAVARRLQALIRPGDTLARFGGDEFAIILGNCKSLPDVCRVADRLLERLGYPFRINNQDVLTSASVGVAVGSPYRQPEEILSDADVAMYRAKARGKACYEIYRYDGQPGSELHLSDLQLALDRDQFLVYFQPVVEINTGALHSLEALIRWCHPARGLLAPSDFLSLVEGTELVHRIGNWVLRQACSQVAKWRKFSPEVAVSVNLSARHLQTPEFVDGVQQIVADVGVSPASLILEVTEKALKNDPGGIGKKLRRLRDSGIRLLVDELGSGRSSLSGLQSVPCESVKIDRSVVAGILCDADSGKILQAIVALARTLRMRVVAEGVESEEQLHEVRRIGCDLAQGFWFSAPLGSEAALALVRSRSRSGQLGQPPV